MSSTQDVRFSEEKIQQGQALANKLCNASRLVLLRVPEDAAAGGAPRAAHDRGPLDPLAPAARRRPTRRARSRASSSPSAALGLYDFVYGELCDWYLELVKPRLYDEADATTARARRRCCTCCARRSRSPTRSSRSSPRRSGAAARRPRGCSPARRWPGADDALLDAAAEDEMGRAIAAIRALRGVARPRRRARRAACCRRALRADGYEATAAHVARLARVGLERTATAASPWRRVAVPGGAVAVLRVRATSTSARPSGRARARRERLRGEIDARRGASSPTRASSPRRPPPWSQAERDKLERLRAELRGAVSAGPPGRSDAQTRAPACSLELFGMRFGLDRMRRLHDGARLAAGGFALDPRRRARTASRSTVRMTAAILEAPRLRTGAYLSPHLVVVRRAHPRRRRATSPGAFAAAVERARARRRRRSTATLEAGDRVTQFEALTAAALRAARRRAASRWRSSRRGSAGARTRRTCSPRAVAGAHERRPRAHALARADGARHRAREARRRARPARRSCVGPTCTPRPSAGAARRRRARGAASSRGRAADAGVGAAARAAPSSGATSRSRAPPPRRCSGALDPARVARGRRDVRVPGRFEVVGRRRR